MNKTSIFLHWLIIGLISIASLQIINYVTNVKEKAIDNNGLLMIGILSAQENFNLRQSIRETWGSIMLNSTMRYSYKFLVSRNMCHIPPEDRVDEYSCNEWIPPKLVDITDTRIISSSRPVKNKSPKPLYLCFSFKTRHAIVLRQLNLHVNAMLYNGSVSVSLYSVTGERIAFAAFTERGTPQDVPPLVLPKGFEGQIVVEDESLHQEENVDCDIEWNDGLGMIRYHHLLRAKDGIIRTFTTDSCPPCSMVFTIHDVESLREHMSTKASRLRLWSRRTEVVKRRLQDEVEERQDVILQDLVDVYRNLPRKLLLFFDGYEDIDVHSRHFFLKTDDDTFIDVARVVTELEYLDHSLGPWWWSCFRDGWPVQRSGKWREDSYLAPTYPPFPCGSGYVLGASAVRYLVRNAGQLHAGFQGEDVAVGVWLAPINPTRHNPRTREACVWAHNEVCLSRGCNRAQLSVEQMYYTWQNYEQCGDLCGCQGHDAT